MCGLAGVWQPEDRADLGTLVESMAATLTHRGPDDSGVWTDDQAGLGLGFRRLAVVDLTAEGHQPMLSASGRYVVVFNGEIYNVRDLRPELERAGHRFRGTSDTEVMLASFEHRGIVDAVRRFVGMFAFALWDREQRELWLGRDRLGVKPLYYGVAGGAVVFGSELKALVAHPRFDRAVDRTALTLLMRHSYIPHPHSIYKHCRQVPPGCLVKLGSVSGWDVAPQPYWSLQDIVTGSAANPFCGSDEEAVEHVNALLRDAVRLRMIADVPVGAFLSGGIDSSLVVALMQEQSGRPVKTFSIGFHEAGYNEAGFAKEVAAHLGTDHSELYVTDDDAQRVIPALPDLYDEPLADTSQLPTFMVSKLARTQVTVALSGDGGDEAFGGYSEYVRNERTWHTISQVPDRVRPALGRAFRIGEMMFGGIATTFTDRLAGVCRANATGFLAPTADQYHDASNAYWRRPTAIVIGGSESSPSRRADLDSVPVPSFVSRLMYRDMRSYLPGSVLAKVDRASMAVGLEARAPLLDHRLIELAWRLPLALKVRDGRGKWVLRQVLQRYVPSKHVDRPKQGFGVPIGRWLRGPLRDWAEELLSRRRLQDEGYFEPRAIRARWKAHLKGRSTWYNTDVALWSVLTFQAWHDRWLGAGRKL